jgi:hypothetical protein
MGDEVVARASVKATLCDRCGRSLGDGRSFTLKAPGGVTVECLRCAVRHRPMLRRSLAAAVVVGSIVLSINQGDVLFRGHWSS